MAAARVLAEAVVGPKPKIEEEIEAVLGDNQMAKAVENVAEAVLDAPVITQGGVEVRGQGGGWVGWSGRAGARVEWGGAPARRARAVQRDRGHGVPASLHGACIHQPPSTHPHSPPRQLPPSPPFSVSVNYLFVLAAVVFVVFICDRTMRAKVPKTIVTREFKSFQVRTNY